MKITNGNSKVIYETSNNNLKTTDPQIEYQVSAAENELVIGEMGKGQAYHLDEGKVEQFAKPDEVQKLQEFAHDMYRLSKRHRKPMN